MTFTYAFRDQAETMAAILADQDHAPIAVFEGRSHDTAATCICPLTEFGEPAKLLAIYEPRS